MDNYIDITMREDTDNIKRPVVVTSSTKRASLIAEHGLSIFIESYSEGKWHRVLFDFGATPLGVPFNLKLLNIPIHKIDAAVLSHGHFDHFGAIVEILKILPKKPLLIYLHPYALWKDRYIHIPGDVPIYMPEFPEEQVKALDGKLITKREPQLICEDTLLISGEIPRKTSFELGFPWAFHEVNGKMEKDQILDDMGVALKYGDKGLVVITGCAHAGVINTLNHFQEICNEKRIFAVIGGFHLTGKVFESVIPPTISNLEKIAPSLIMPAHCTGWKATNLIAETFPNAFVLSTVGTTIHLK